MRELRIWALQAINNRLRYLAEQGQLACRGQEVLRLTELVRRELNDGAESIDG